MGLLRQNFTSLGGAACSIEIKSQMFLMLRRPRLERTIIHPASHFRDENFYVKQIFIGDRLVFERAGEGAYQVFSALGLIRFGESLTAVMQNTSALPHEDCFVVEGDEVRQLHWGVHCKKDCPDCRWLTACHHDECECMPEMARLCGKSQGFTDAVQLVTRDDVPGAPVLQAFREPGEPAALMRFDVPGSSSSSLAAPAGVAFGASGMLLGRAIVGPDGPLTPARLLGR